MRLTMVAILLPFTVPGWPPLRRHPATFPRARYGIGADQQGGGTRRVSR